MSGALDRFVASIRSFLTGPEKEADPLHRMYDLEEEEEEESEAITVSEDAVIAVEKLKEA
jgi:hypothetical protein